MTWEERKTERGGGRRRELTTTLVNSRWGVNYCRVLGLIDYGHIFSLVDSGGVKGYIYPGYTISKDVERT